MPPRVSSPTSKKKRIRKRLLYHTFIRFPTSFPPASRRLFKNTHFELQITLSAEGTPRMFANDCGRKGTYFWNWGTQEAPGSLPVSPWTGWGTGGPLISTLPNLQQSLCKVPPLYATYLGWERVPDREKLVKLYGENVVINVGREPMNAFSWIAAGSVFMAIEVDCREVTVR